MTKNFCMWNLVLLMTQKVTHLKQGWKKKLSELYRETISKIEINQDLDEDSYKLSNTVLL